MVAWAGDGANYYGAFCSFDRGCFGLGEILKRLRMEHFKTGFIGPSHQHKN